MSSHLFWWMLCSKIQRNYPDLLHIKGEDGKLKYNQFQKMHLKYFEGLYFWILLPFFLLLLLLCVCGIFIVSIAPTVLWKTLTNKIKRERKMRYWLTYHIGRRKIDGIRLFSRLHKWTKWNNRLVMSEVVWSRGEKKNISEKITIVKLMVYNWHDFLALKDYSYFNITSGRIGKKKWSH